MSTNDPKIKKLLTAMKNVPEKLAAKWLEVTETTNARIAEFEKSFSEKEAEFKKVTDKLADVEQEFSDFKASSEKTIAEKTKEITKLTTELKELKEKPAAGNISDDFLNIVTKFISDISAIIDGKKSTVVSEVKPIKNIEKTVITDPVEKPVEKKKTETKKETPVVKEEKQMSDDESVDTVLAELGITDL